MRRMSSTLRELTRCGLTVAGLTVGGLAIASPTSIQVCTQVVDNGDANKTEGGNWSYTVANQTVTYATPATTRDESQAASPVSCDSAATPPAGSTALSVLQNATPPANWLRNAPGYPQWTVTDGAHTVSGSGALDITGGAYSQFTGATVVTFTNASGRLVNKVCSALQDNAAPPSGQSGSFTLSAGGVSTSLTNTEGAGAACDTDFQANIPLGATSLATGDATPFPMESGYPTVTVSDAGSHSDTAMMTSADGDSPYSASVGLAGTSGDVTVTFANKIIADRDVTICKILEDNGDGIDQGGSNTVVYNTLGQSVSMTVTEGSTTPSCAAPVPAPLSDTTTEVREMQLSSAFQGFATGYPKWAIYDATNPATPVLSGNGTVADIPWGNAALSNLQAVRVVFTDKAGAFGNGTQANTGAVTRVCKYVQDNLDGVAQAGSFTIYGNVPNTYAYASGTTPTIGEGTLSCPTTMARWSASEQRTFFEPYQQGGGWPGDAAGFPQLKIYNVANPTPGNTPVSSAQMAFEETTVTANYTATTAMPAGDTTAVFVNQAGAQSGSAPKAQTLTFCMRVDDNGLAPTNDGGSWGFNFPVSGTVNATENSGTSCLAPIALPDPNGTWTQSDFQESIALPASWPGFDTYANGTPVAASPYALYTTTGGQSGQLDASALFGPYGVPVINWSQPQSFFQGLSGNLTVTIVARPSARYQVCGQVLQNGDSTDDSNSFVLGASQGATAITASKTLTEGQAPQCVQVLRMPNAGAFNATEGLPATWDSSNNTSGFPKWTITSNGPTPLNVVGSGLMASNVPQAPAAQQGDTTVTFSNRLGALRTVTFCEEVTDNGDTKNDGGAFSIAGSSDDPNALNLGTFPLTATEQSGRVCSAPVQVPVFAANVGGAETLPAGFISAAGFPTWHVETDSGTTALSGTGSSTGNIDLNKVPSPDFSVIFSNKQSTAADLKISKTDNATTYTPGSPITYTITVENLSPVNASGFTISDPVPAIISNVTVTCSVTGAGSCGTNASSGNSVSFTGAALPAGAANAITLIVKGTVSASATGALTNTATVTSSSDPDMSNNTATDTDTADVSADLSIINSDGATSVSAGSNVVYTVIASNAGPSDATGANVQYTFPASLTGLTWTCTGLNGATCPASGSNSLNTTVNLPHGSSVTFTVSATVSATATGSITTTATIATPSGLTDPAPANNTATDVDTVAPQTDLSITMSDGRTTYTPGGPLTYTIVVTNPGPADEPRAGVSDNLPAQLLGATWTCTGANGGNLSRERQRKHQRDCVAACGVERDFPSDRDGGSFHHGNADEYGDSHGS